MDEGLEEWLGKASHIISIINEVGPLLAELIEFAPNEALRGLSVRFQAGYDQFCLNSEKDIMATGRTL